MAAVAAVAAVVVFDVNISDMGISGAWLERLSVIVGATTCLLHTETIFMCLFERAKNLSLDFVLTRHGVLSAVVHCVF